MNALARLFAFDYWANSRTIDQVMALSINDPRILHWLNHLMNAEEMWLSRVQGENPKISIHTQRPLSALSTQCQVLHDGFQQVISQASTTGLQELINFRDSRGTAYAIPLHDILTHVANHSTHHRGQVIARIREVGFEPVRTDYIHYVQHNKPSYA
ncbi:MAG: DinB family protein [Bacteroidota bacterium]